MKFLSGVDRSGTSWLLLLLQGTLLLSCLFSFLLASWLLISAVTPPAFSAMAESWSEREGLMGLPEEEDNDDDEVGDED